MLTQALLWAAGGSGFTPFDDHPWGGHRLSLSPDGCGAGLHRIMLGFAARRDDRRQYVVASDPRHRAVPGRGTGWIPAAGGSILGIAFLAGMDVLLPISRRSFWSAGQEPAAAGTPCWCWPSPCTISRREWLWASPSPLAAQADITLLPASMALALGIGIQNFPRARPYPSPATGGMGSGRSFLMGAASGVVEPIAALITVLAAGTVQPLMPWLLSFAAGAMLYVVVEELIPEANLRHNHETHGAPSASWPTS